MLLLGVEVDQRYSARHFGGLKMATVSLLTSTPVIRAFRPRRSLILAIPILLGSLLQACGGGGGPAPSNIKIHCDRSDQSVGRSWYQDTVTRDRQTKKKPTEDLTGSATWTSTSSTVANVSNSHPTRGLARWFSEETHKERRRLIMKRFSSGFN